MQKHAKRREFLKLKSSGLSYKKCQIELKERFGITVTVLTLKRWNKRFLTDDEWDLRDINQRPEKLNSKFSTKEKESVSEIRKRFGYGPKKTRIQALKTGVDMSISTIKRIIKS